MELSVLKDIIVPIIIGVLSSVIFLLLASRVKPNLVVSEHIADMTKLQNPCRERGYAVKIVNKSTRSATEINAKLFLVHMVNIAGGQIKKLDALSLVNESIFELPGYKKDNPEESAFRFITLEDIGTKWEDNATILFTVQAKDSLSGFGKVFSKAYFLKRDVLKNGEFEVGHSMRIA